MQSIASVSGDFNKKVVRLLPESVDSCHKSLQKKKTFWNLFFLSCPFEIVPQWTEDTDTGAAGLVAVNIAVEVCNNVTESATTRTRLTAGCRARDPRHNSDAATPTRALVRVKNRVFAKRLTVDVWEGGTGQTGGQGCGVGLHAKYFLVFRSRHDFKQFQAVRQSLTEGKQKHPMKKEWLCKQNLSQCSSPPSEIALNPIGELPTRFKGQFCVFLLLRVSRQGRSSGK